MSRKLLVAAGVELFEETGEWPKIDWVQGALVTWRDETNARREARRLPARLGGVKNGRLVLGVQAFHETEPGSRLLEAFRIGLREAWTRYRNAIPPADALLSVADLENQASLSVDEAKRTIELLAVEGLLERKTERVWKIAPTIRYYKTAKTVEEYLEVRRRYERKRCFRRIPARAIQPLRGTLESDGWARPLIITTFATLLAALALWIGEEIFGSPSSGGDYQPPPKSQPKANLEGIPANRRPPSRAGRR